MHNKAKSWHFLVNKKNWLSFSKKKLFFFKILCTKFRVSWYLPFILHFLIWSFWLIQQILWFLGCLSRKKSSVSQTLDSTWTISSVLWHMDLFWVHFRFISAYYITIFSNKLNRVILIELTCPCQENIEAWHKTKVNKYLSLKSVIENIGWTVYLLAVEFGTRGYCSSLVFSCLKSLGLRNGIISTTIQQVSV